MATFMLLNFGLRLNELIQLNLSDFNFDEKELLVRRSKYKRSRIIPFNRQIQQVIFHWLDTRENYLPVSSKEVFITWLISTGSIGTKFSIVL